MRPAAPLPSPLVFGLLACILLVSAPHAEHLPLWVSTLCSALLAWRAYLSWSGNPLPPRWLLLGVTIASVAAIAITFRSLFGRDVGVTLLILLVTLKLLELRSVRDATLLIYLACFIIITNFFYSQSIPTALFMLATLLAIMATWVHLHTGDLRLKPRLRIAGILLLQAIPLSLVLFVLFPRVQGPLWGMPQDAYASSGLSDTMAPGSISRLSLSDAVAFRVTFGDRTPLRGQMYWRGPVLWDFDGTTWTRGHGLAMRPPSLADAGTPLAYTVTLEPHNKPWLFALEMPDKISIRAFQTSDFQLLNRRPVNTRLRYEATSHLSYRASPDEPPQQLQRALELPSGFNPRTRQLAQEWRTEHRDDQAVMDAALAYFNRNGFEYTLEPPLLGTNSVDDFLFRTRKGFCEHYASSFVFLMRAAGIPARVVTGYQGGEFNDLGGYYVLRQYDAHAWAEVWLRERGWVRVDPTGAIAPSRIQDGLNAALPGNTALPFLARTHSSLLLKLRVNLDALANQWNQWVLGYDSERQFAFLTRLGMEDITWKKLALNMLGGVALLAGLFTLFMLRRLAVRQHDAVQAAYLRFCRKLDKHGTTRAAHEGARDFAARAAQRHPQHAAQIAAITARYIALRYGDARGTEALRAFRDAVRAFKL
jgi:transglutaminase-like putative cysteine protease